MFPNAFFGRRFFPARFWPKAGAPSGFQVSWAQHANRVVITVIYE